MRWIVGSQSVPFLMEVIRQSDAVEPLLQPLPFALGAKLQAAKEVVALAQILVPYGQYEHLLVEVMRAGLEGELLVENGIQCAPLDRRLVLLVLVRVRFQLPRERERNPKRERERGRYIERDVEMPGYVLLTA